MSRLPRGIGAKGSAQARFFHLSQHIREKMAEQPQDKAGFGGLACGEGGPIVSIRKDQLCYEYRIPKIRTEPYSTFAAATSKSKKPLQPHFVDELVVMTVVAAHQDPERERTTALRESKNF